MSGVEHGLIQSTMASQLGVDEKPPSAIGVLLHKSTNRYVNLKLGGIIFRRSYRESGATRHLKQ